MAHVESASRDLFFFQVKDACIYVCKSHEILALLHLFARKSQLPQFKIKGFSPVHAPSVWAPGDKIRRPRFAPLARVYVGPTGCSPSGSWSRVRTRGARLLQLQPSSHASASRWLADHAARISRTSQWEEIHSQDTAPVIESVSHRRHVTLGNAWGGAGWGAELSQRERESRGHVQVARAELIYLFFYILSHFGQLRAYPDADPSTPTRFLSWCLARKVYLCACNCCFFFKILLCFVWFFLSTH